MAFKTLQRRYLAVGASLLLASAAAMAGPNVDVQVNLPGLFPPPVVVQPAPVYVQPRTVYVQPAPVYVQPRPVIVTQPVYVQRDDFHGDCKHDKCKHKSKHKKNKHRDRDD